MLLVFYIKIFGPFLCQLMTIDWLHSKSKPPLKAWNIYCLCSKSGEYWLCSWLLGCGFDHIFNCTRIAISLMVKYRYRDDVVCIQGQGISLIFGRDCYINFFLHWLEFCFFHSRPPLACSCSVYLVKSFFRDEKVQILIWCQIFLSKSLWEESITKIGFTDILNSETFMSILFLFFIIYWVKLRK
jgi:hypothetical protein